MKQTLKVVLAVFLAVMTLAFHGCGPNTGTADEATGGPPPDTAMNVANLQKLCKVWGYVKYTHSAFLLGQKDWDEELLALVEPTLAAASEEEENEILRNWIASLGEINYGTDFIDQRWANAPERDKLPQADRRWIDDAEYLGEGLAEALSPLEEVPVVSLLKAPVRFTAYGDIFICEFSNEKTFENVDYANVGYRMLGLFRVWNVLEYYYPYLDIIDENWNDALCESIEEMLAGNDKRSYRLTLMSLTAKLQDAHITYADLEPLLDEVGRYAVPAYLIRAEGQLVIKEIPDEHLGTSRLLPGDVVIAIDGVEIGKLIEQCRQYISGPNDEKLLNAVSPFLLRGHGQNIDITVLRNDEEVTLEVQGVFDTYFFSLPRPEQSHKLIEGNIGLINPGKLSGESVDEIMTEFADTDGLIVDLRQYPATTLGSLEQYIVGKRADYAVLSTVSKTVPGVFLKAEPQSSGNRSGQLLYVNPVVLLMDEVTQSSGEHAISSLRGGENVVVIGRNSVGANGGTVIFPLPDGDLFRFTNTGVYTPHGGQTQRIGLSPDIYVEPTIDGIKAGRDELMEAAVEYIQNTKNVK